jgi:hypothetical protein
MSVAVWSGSGLAWDRELTALKDRLAPVFRRSDVAASAGAFIDGLLSGIPRKTGWLLAEQAGLKRPYRMQSLLGRSSWNADALRDRVRAEAIASLGDPVCWWSTRRDFSRRASTPSAWQDSIQALLAGLKTAKWAYFLATPAGLAKP